MNISFKYNGKIWTPKNPEKKLKQLGITLEDVEIITTGVKEQKEIEYEDPNRLYYFLNPKTGYSITSIHSELQDHIKNKNEYVRTTKETLERYWNKDGTV